MLRKIYQMHLEGYMHKKWQDASQDFRLLNHVLFQQRRPKQIKQKLVWKPVRYNVAIVVQITDWIQRWGYNMWYNFD